MVATAGRSVGGLPHAAACGWTPGRLSRYSSSMVVDEEPDRLGALYRIAWIATAIVFVIGALCVFGPQLNHYHRMLAQKESKEAEEKAMNAAIGDLQDRQERFRTNARFVERTAREIGMVKPDEVLLKDTRAEEGRTP